MKYLLLALFMPGFAYGNDSGVEEFAKESVNDDVSHFRKNAYAKGAKVIDGAKIIYLRKKALEEQLVADDAGNNGDGFMEAVVEGSNPLGALSGSRPATVKSVNAGSAGGAFKINVVKPLPDYLLYNYHDGAKGKNRKRTQKKVKNNIIAIKR